ncbi:tetratricopeptide repeat protein [Chlorobium sp. BLA1]|uniref:tetratricopeptide repeat protein n=1 Tax=Candidatus Chlorobium masyuteum TaxID=2716876 RepID=UPI001423156E|nr:tetratricopeptide repeat protein [Candidatus Chlorobium masyuteum]NHQ59035.1 tetratricopeptide repeat protein [Candidatus Chlorobium masyuteum]
MNAHLKPYFYCAGFRETGTASDHPHLINHLKQLSCLWLFASLFIVFTTLPTEAKSAAEVFADVSGSVVVIHNYDKNEKLQNIGSGVMLASGKVATNYHVIEQTGKITVIYKGREYPATPLYFDRFRDVCSLNVPGLPESRITIGSTHELKTGDKVYALGAPQGIELTFSDGIISGLRQVDKGFYIQTTAPISAGSSGGGLFDENGRLIGLPTYFFKQGQQLNFALPVEWILDLPNRVAVQDTILSADLGNVYQVNALEERQDWGGMISFCQNWIKQKPESGEACGYLGFAYLQRGDLSLSIDSYNNAIRLRPDYAQYWVDLGAAYGREGQKQKKIEAYRQAVSLNTDYAVGWLNLAMAYVQNGEVERAIDAYEQAVRITPHDASSWYHLGLVLSDGGQFDKAVKAYQQAVRITPGHALYFLSLARAYGYAAQPSESYEAYKSALRINPDYSDAWVFLGVAYDKDHRIAEALNAYLQALRINPDHNTALFNLGRFYLETGSVEKGMAVYVRLKQLNPEMAQLFFNTFNKLMFSKNAL